MLACPVHTGLPNRHEAGNECRYGVNGMEKDDEIKGEGNSYDFWVRIYDSRVGRWLSVDNLEKKYPMNSTYVFVSNSPLIIDPDGDVKPENSLAQRIADKTGSTVYALQNRSDYADILPEQGWIEVFFDDTYDRDAGSWDTDEAVEKTKYPVLGPTPETSPGRTIFRKNQKPIVVDK